MNFADGFETIFEKGDFVRGIQTMLPLSIGNLFRAYELHSSGYLDRNGRKMPMSPGAFAILSQAIGFNPAAKAEYSEAAQVQRDYTQGQRKMMSGLNRKVLDAIRSNDPDALRKVLESAGNIALKNPDINVAQSMRSSITGTLMSEMLSRATGLPLGSKTNSVPGALERVNFANY